ncbi:hypothetical protein [Serratia proteamaculans]|uniref:hypothetical protein n=1 Tax=Serratia proteamaculans TaxID=28151 RepID=UPI003D086821
MKKMIVSGCVASTLLLSGCISLGKQSHHNRPHYYSSQYEKNASYQYDRERGSDYRKN